MCGLIDEREAKLDQLQTFEKSASDPHRLFTKGMYMYMYMQAFSMYICLHTKYKARKTFIIMLSPSKGQDGLSTARLQEAKRRKRFHSVC